MRVTTPHTPSQTKAPSYGVREQVETKDEIDKACEALKLVGYAVVDGGYTEDELAKFSTSFDLALEQLYAKHGKERLQKIDEHNTIRVLMELEPMFLQLAINRRVLEICNRLIGGTIVLNQQNGVINPPLSDRYNQSSFHRDLPYQHFVSSRPLAINALFCIDQFTTKNGGTFVVPASHKQEMFTSDASLPDLQVQVSAPAGSFIILDCMLYHAGGKNQTEQPRRAVNHVYTIPLIKQQISLPSVLGPDVDLNDFERTLLGYDFRTPESVEQYYAGRD